MGGGGAFSLTCLLDFVFRAAAEDHAFWNREVRHPAIPVIALTSRGSGHISAPLPERRARCGCRPPAVARRDGARTERGSHRGRRRRRERSRRRHFRHWRGVALEPRRRGRLRRTPRGPRSSRTLRARSCSRRPAPHRKCVAARRPSQCPRPCRGRRRRCWRLAPRRSPPRAPHRARPLRMPACRPTHRPRGALSVATARPLNVVGSSRRARDTAHEGPPPSTPRVWGAEGARCAPGRSRGRGDIVQTARRHSHLVGSGEFRITVCGRRFVARRSAE